MIPIREIAGIVHPEIRERRALMFFRFYCDESYDGKAFDPDFFTISGFFSDQPTWEEVEEDWQVINLRYGVSAFHATELNGRTGEYEDWCKSKACEYSAELLHAINRQKRRMRAYNCGIRGDHYRRIISNEGQIKLGHPWICCFQSCVAMIAKDMETLPIADSFSVIMARENRFDLLAVSAFGQMAVNPLFPYRHRLMTCTPAPSDKVIALQVADLMAYEYYKRLRQHRQGDVSPPPRPPLKLIQDHNDYVEGFFGESWFMQNREIVDSIQCGPNQLVIIPDLTRQKG